MDEMFVILVLLATIYTPKLKLSGCREGATSSPTAKMSLMNEVANCSSSKKGYNQMDPPIQMAPDRPWANIYSAVLASYYMD